MNQFRPQGALSVASLKVIMVGILEESLKSIDRLRDREWILREIARIRNPQTLTGDMQRNIKSTGMVRPVDELGRIVIPKELRRTMDIESLEPLEIYTEGQWVVLEKPGSLRRCVVCGSNDDLSPFKNKYICETCLGDMFDESFDREEAAQ